MAVEDLEEPSVVCEMCETREIRFVHHMTHPEYSSTLAVGCVCAEHMENDYEGPQRREQEVRNAARRRQNWLKRKWRASAAGNSFINTDGLNITIYRKNDGTWGGRILERAGVRAVESRRIYTDEAAAKLGAFDAMIVLKAKGWGR